MKRGLALGCGGTLGAAWTVGVLSALKESEGWDPRSADAIIGTSAGAEFGAMLAAGVPITDLAAAHLETDQAPDWLCEHLAGAPAPLPPFPSPRPMAPRLTFRTGVPRSTRIAGLMPTGRGSNDRMRQLGEHLAGPNDWTEHPSFHVVAVDLESGFRSVFNGSGSSPARLAQAVEASWAVPGCFPPVGIEGRRFIDGGVASAASVDLLADLVPDLDEIIVVAPMASATIPRPRGVGMRIEAHVRKLMSIGLAAECAAAEARGIRVRRFLMSPESLQVAGPNFNDVRRRKRLFEQSLDEHLREL